MEKGSLLNRHLTSEMEGVLAGLATSRGATLGDVVRSGKENPDSSVGIYAPDEEAYDVFWGLFGPVIGEYHSISDVEGLQHPTDMTIEQADFVGADEYQDLIISTRVRVGRNLAGIGLAPSITREGRLEVERRARETLKGLSGDLSGTYHPLGDMAEDIRAKLVENHLLFKQGDRFLESAGANRDWPEGRGIYLSNDQQFIVWVNEEDQLRIISLEQGGGLFSVYERLVRAATELEKRLTFARSDRLGYISSCPTNLGTAMRASFHMQLPKLEKSGRLKELAEELGLSIRGIHGEHSESVGGVNDISNKRRLGLSERDAVLHLHEGARVLAREELLL